MNTNDGFLLQALIFLGAGVIAVPVFKRLGLGSVLGYLVAGIAIGPWGLRLVQDPHTVLGFAELGVVLLLFLLSFLTEGQSELNWKSALEALSIIALLIFAGRFLVRPVMRFIAETRMREVFVGFSLLVVLGTAALMEWVGLSMALGAF